MGMNTKQHKSIFPDLLPHAVTSKHIHLYPYADFDTFSQWQLLYFE